MSQPFFNRTARDYLSILRHNDGPLTDQIYDVSLVADYQQDDGANPTPPILRRIQYPLTFSNGVFEVDGGGNVIIQKAGLYSVTAVAVFDDSLKDGYRRQQLSVDQGGIQYEVGTDSSPISSAAPTTTMSTILNTNTVLNLGVGDILEHKVSYTGAAVPIIVVGATSSPTNYTKVILVLLDQAA